MHDSAHYGECSTHTLKHQDLKTLGPKTSLTHSRSFDLKPKGINSWPKFLFCSTKTTLGSVERRMALFNFGVDVSKMRHISFSF